VGSIHNELNDFL